MTASHRAEPAHTEVLEGFARKVNISEAYMVCASSWPLDEKNKEALLRDQRDKSKWFHNCSGKHYGMLAYCQMKGYPPPDTISRNIHCRRSFRRSPICRDWLPLISDWERTVAACRYSPCRFALWLQPI